MMKFKKFLAAAMAGVMMLGVAVTAAPRVSAYADASFTLEPDYEHYTLDLTATGSDTYAFVQVWKLDSDGEFKSAGTTYSIPLDNKKATMDLSFLKATTAQGLRVWGDATTTPTDVIVNAQPAKLSLKYDAVKGLFTGKIGGNAIPSTGLDIGTEVYQYRGQYASEWSKLEDFSKVNHTSAGSTIVIRTAAVKSGDNAAPAGAEVKVKIAAAAKAPKVSIDYVKGIVSFPKGVAYYDETQKGFVEIKEAASKAWKATLADLAKYGVTDTALKAGDVTLLVCTAATDKKPASNVTAVTFSAVPQIADTAVNSEKTGITVSSDVTVTGKIANATKHTYQFTVKGASFDFSLDKGSTWKTVKSGSAFTVTQSTTSQDVLVRLTGVKGSAFASNSVTLTVPKIETEDDDDDNSGSTPSPSPSPTPGGSAG